jgi:hypothetical protein
MIDSICSNTKWTLFMWLSVCYTIVSKVNMVMCVLKTFLHTILAIIKKIEQHKNVLVLLDTKFKMSLHDVDTLDTVSRKHLMSLTCLIPLAESVLCLLNTLGIVSRECLMFSRHVWQNVSIVPDMLRVETPKTCFTRACLHFTKDEIKRT